MKLVKLSVFALTMGLFVASCGNSETPAETPAATVTPAETPAAEPTPAAAPATTDSAATATPPAEAAPATK